MSRRSLILANALFRIGYGAGGLVAPSAMAKFGLTPDTEERPDARLFVRGFSAHQIGVAALGLASIRRRELERPAMLAAAAIDVADMITAVVEGIDRRRVDTDLAGGLVFSAAGVATALAAIRAPD
jgi:Domain of unknown function (DUF4267)